MANTWQRERVDGSRWPPSVSGHRDLWRYRDQLSLRTIPRGRPLPYDRRWSGRITRGLGASPSSERVGFRCGLTFNAGRSYEIDPGPDIPVHPERRNRHQKNVRTRSTRGASDRLRGDNCDGSQGCRRGRAQRARDASTTLRDSSQLSLEGSKARFARRWRSAQSFTGGT